MHSIAFKTFLTIYFLCFVLIVNSQETEIVQVEGEARVEFPEYKSLLEVKNDAKNAAIINAMEKAFGVAIIQGNASYEREVNSVNSNNYTSVFNSIGNQWVNGDLIEIVRIEFEEVGGVIIVEGRQKAYKQMKCYVLIKAMEIKDNVVDFEAFPLDCKNIKCRTNEFTARVDDFYLYYKCPVSGYLAIFLDDGKQAQRLFPYQNMGKSFEQGVPVDANKEYILFSNERSNNPFGSTADEYVFEIGVPMEQNILYIIFSHNPIVQPYTKKNLDKGRLTVSEKKEGWSIPSALSSYEFMEWVSKNRAVNRNIKIEMQYIIIRK